jgi:hypothetical protein
MYELPSKLVSLLAQASVFVQAKKHKLTTKYVHFLPITSPQWFMIQAREIKFCLPNSIRLGCSAGLAGLVLNQLGLAIVGKAEQT